MTEIQIICSLIAILIGVYCLITVTTKMRAGKDPVPKKDMSKWQQGKSDKLRKSDPTKFYNNLWENICPLCGKDMELHTYGTYDQFSDHWCTHCGFITKCEVLA